MQDMLDRQVARKLDRNDLNYVGPVHHITHHEVLKAESSTTPWRTVFNASANYCGRSLNGYWEKGPDLLNNLMGILIKFREEDVGYIGDIRKMYHTVRITMPDQQTHRFLWRDLNPEKKPEEYMMEVVSFGDKPAATIVLLALRKTADLATNDQSQAKAVIYTSTYMDDSISSVNTIGEAAKQTTSIDNILQKDSFRIKKWVYSGDSDGEVPLMGSIEDQKVLGMVWDNGKDVLKYTSQVKIKEPGKKGKKLIFNTLKQLESEAPTCLTRRQVLCQLNSVFDPLGLVAPFVLKGKLLMRETWETENELASDDNLAADVSVSWLLFFKELFQLQKVEIRRCARSSFTAVGSPTLVLFSDASQVAFGACAYVV